MHASPSCWLNLLEDSRLLILCVQSDVQEWHRLLILHVAKKCVPFGMPDSIIGWFPLNVGSGIPESLRDAAWHDDHDGSHWMSNGGLQQVYKMRWAFWKQPDIIILLQWATFNNLFGRGHGSGQHGARVFLDDYRSLSPKIDNQISSSFPGSTIIARNRNRQGITFA